MARFEDLQHSLWDTSSAYGVQPPLTAQAIVNAERLLDVTLPSALLVLLRHRNGGGGADSWDAFPTTRPTSWSPDHVAFGFVMGIGLREQNCIGLRDQSPSILTSPYLVAEWGLPTPVVLLSESAPCWIGLDYRVCGRHGEPSVTWFDAERHTELSLAPDFRSFLEGLTATADFEDTGTVRTSD
ncbi:SMI1/KNR4 family protein [Streptomyces clavifer]|uniref:SMI1/KNR4 family protein n=1 Tax=Streptomyces clavifer TaxID=68188 RepID=UPI00379A0D73